MISTTVPPTSVDVSGLATSSALATVDTVVDSILVDTAAIKAVTNNLPNSGALTNLDVAVSSVKRKAQVNLVRDTAVSTRTLFTGANGSEGHGAVYTAGTITAPTYVELMSVTAAGWLYLVVTYRESTFASGTLSTRITIDGDVWDVVTDSTSTTQYAGHVALGVVSDDSKVIIPLAMRFDTSMKVEVVSSVNQSAGRVSARILYSLDT